ncbi:MAG: TAXI family TRAP transporter solute-binding subunit [Rhodospirillaceae bacterium]|nr:TAXI family TRAP transporter solute-binding subunit [Rhodospirillaceae bacterium]
MLARCALLACVTLAAGGPALPQELIFFRMGTGTTGGTYFPIGGIIASAISGPPGSPPCELGGSCGVPGLIAVAQASSGSVENVRNLAAGSIELGLSQSDVAFYAFTGTGVFADTGPMLSLRGIASLYVEQVHLVVRADSDVQSIDDLAGHSVSIGEEGSGILVASRLILDAYGLSEADIEPAYLDPEVSADRIEAGELDAMIAVAGAPMLAIADLARRVPIRLIPINGEGAQLLLQEQPFFAEAELEEGTYDGVGEVPTIGVSAVLLGVESLDADIVYGITKALWHPSTEALLTNAHPRGREIRVENALNGLAVPLHPGAIRYYSEINLFGPTEPQ